MERARRGFCWRKDEPSSARSRMTSPVRTTSGVDIPNDTPEFDDGQELGQCRGHAITWRARTTKCSVTDGQFSHRSRATLGQSWTGQAHWSPCRYQVTSGAMTVAGARLCALRSTRPARASQGRQRASARHAEGDLGVGVARFGLIDRSSRKATSPRSATGYVSPTRE